MNVLPAGVPMNVIAQLESNIAQVELMLIEDQAWLKAEPDNIAAQVQLASTKNHLQELQHKLKLEKEKRNKEVIDLRLSGLPGTLGTIPLDLLAKIAKELSSAIHATAYFRKYGKELKGQIPKSLIWETDLRLVGLEPGSTRLIISGATRPNLFGQSITEDSINAIYGIVEAQDYPRMADAVAQAGVTASHSFARLCKTIARRKSILAMTWDSPIGERRIFEGTKDRLKDLSKTLIELAVIPPEEIQVIGTLDLAGVKGQFEISAGFNRQYRGRYPETLFEKVRDIPIGSAIFAVINKETIANQTTGYSKVSYTLLDICKLEDYHEKIQGSPRETKGSRRNPAG